MAAAREPDASRDVFSGSLVDVVVETWGDRAREVVRHKGACAIVAITDDGDVVLVRQFRHAIREDVLEIPAGVLDVEGETAADCAARELAEETGYEAHDVRPLASIATSPGFTDERVQLFVARAERRGDPHGDEDLDVVVMPLDEAVTAARDGRIVDAKTVVGLVLAGAARGTGVRSGAG